MRTGIYFSPMIIRILTSAYRPSKRQFASMLVTMLRSNTQRKHVWRWLRSQQPGYLLTEALPWLTYDTIDFITSRLTGPVRVFEYGSGGSTLFWSRFDVMCVSVEHDPEWFTLVRERLAGNHLKGAAQVDYRLIEPECGVTTSGDIADPTCYLSDDANVRGCTFRAYASQIDSFPDGYFDLVLVDGRARPACIMHGAPKVRPGGMLVLDNADRAYYTAQTQPYLRNFQRLEFSGAVPVNAEFSRTDIYIRD